MKQLDRDSIDPDADRVVRKLAKGGHKAYLVGGCVRDLLLGKKPKDFDVATSATPNEVKSLFRNCRIIGRRFRLATVFFGDKIIETATFRANPRDEEEGGEGELLIRRDNVFGTETDDARRRDFTINGLFYDVEAERVIDHVDGLRDLERRQIRTIGDPEVRFQEDPVRMLRAIKFAARLDLEIEPETYRALIRWRHELHKAAPPRVLEEVYRLVRGGAAHRSMELLVETGFLPLLSPQLAELFQGDGSPRLRLPADDEAPPARRIAIAPVDDEGTGDDEDYDLPAHDDAPVDTTELAASLLTDDDEPVRELDAEELAWRRVWLDQPARPHRAHRASAATAAPVVPSHPGDPALAPQRAAAWQVLRAIDASVAAGTDPSNAVALAALLCPFVLGPLATCKPAEVQQVVTRWSLPMIEQLRVTRRDSERLRQLLLAQRRIQAALARGEKPELMGGREFFTDALLLAELTSGQPVAMTLTPGGGGDADADGEDGEDGDGRKRRRRRRGGRRRRREDGAVDGAAT